jgi:mono/diheme cytochrome c family protein/DNA-binding beta-propeller fold protein YncE
VDTSLTQPFEITQPVSTPGRFIFLLLTFVLLPGVAMASAASDSHVLYQQHCASCHGADRLGLQGPALLPQNLGRLRKSAAIKTISDGRAASQMPAFKQQLSAEQISLLVDFIYTPLAKMPVWDMAQIKASQIVYHPPGELPDKPKFNADIDNLFTVVELGDHHATLLNGDTFEPIFRFPTRFALHGGPKYSDGGRYVYFASRDGWISKFDIFNLTYVAEVRAGINTRNLAVSDDGRFVMVANYLPHTLVILDARDLSPVKVIAVTDQAGKSSRVSAVYTAAPRSSFIVALKDIPELWEISYQDPPPLGFGEWIHDYRNDSGEGGSGELFPIRRIHTQGFLDDFFITQDYSQVAGTARDGKGQIVDLDLGRAVSALELPGMPHLSSGISWQYQDKTVLALPNIKASQVTILDTDNWKIIKQIKTDGPGFFMRSHENSPYAWTDVFFGEHRDEMHVIDKKTLEIVNTLIPAPGKTSAHVEFTKDGKYAIVSIWDMDGAIVIYDANTLQEVKRLPMKKPSGKYNVHNKLTRSAGTSH